ncbi:MAG: hypothetical protein JRK53_10690 [Deltaproteobacteria bacterium]|nr:hypothetical protein [Deltaproteobacteria bacterium]MBW1816736.1 hypothetical protein [Deltaproteobacteria bacterium]
MTPSKAFFTVVSVFVALIFVGCYTTPGYYGYISETVSKIDNTRQISMKPFPVGDSPLKLGMYKSSTMPKDMVLLVVQLQGAHNFDKGSLLRFNIDATPYSFPPYQAPGLRRSSPDDINVLVYDATSHWSTERYAVTMDFIRNLYTAHGTVVRVDLGNEFYEGSLFYHSAVSDRTAIKSFHDRVMKW